MADGSRSSSAVVEKNSNPSWLLWVIPSVADLIFVAVLGAILFTPLSVKLLGDAGIGWHIRTGQQILHTRSIPRVDSFSSVMQGKPWFAWEWLYDVIVGLLDSAWGLNGPLWFTAIAIAAVFAWMFRLVVSRGADLFVGLILVLLALSASTIHFLVRPHVLSWLFTLIWFWILDSTEQDSFGGRYLQGRKPWLLPAVMLLWVNVHGSFLLGFALLGIYWLGAFWTWWRTNESRLEERLQKIAAGKRVRDLMLIGIASAFASLINPYGWKLYQHIFGYLSNRFLMDHIEEFRSPDFHGVAQRCFLVLLLLVLGVVMGRGRQLRVSQALTILLAVYSGLYASRNIPVASILLTMIAAPLFPGISHFRGFAGRMEKVESELKGHLWPLLAVVLTGILVANDGRIGSNQLVKAHFDPVRMPVQAVSFLRDQDIKGAILSPDSWGGYLIYELYPHNRVVIDDRHDLYGESFLRSYLTMMHVEPGWEDFLKPHGDCVLLPRKSALAAMLGKTAKWTTVYSDDVAIIFIPAEQRQGSERALSH
jgi:hypothetical protein